MATMATAGMGRRLASLVVAIALSFSATACASGPLGSHGVDYIPSFDAPPPSQ